MSSNFEVNMSALATHVTAAANILDKVKRGWAKKIAINRLNMTSSDDCILGQLWNSYSIGWNKLAQLKPKLIQSIDRMTFIEPSARKLWEYEVKKRLKKK